MNPHLTLIIGCTGCGKGGLGRELARRTGGHIISLDSMKIYRRMDIGTAKPSARARREIPHHLLDIVDPCDDFSVAQYLTRAERAIEQIAALGKPIYLVGGTALYIKALTEGLFDGPGADPDLRDRLRRFARDHGSDALHARLQQVDPTAASRIHPNDLRRIVRALEVYELTGTPISTLQSQWDRDRTRYPCTILGIRRTLEDQNHRTNQRVKSMMQAGLLDEVRSLLAEPMPLSETARKAVGYAELMAHLNGELSLAEATELIKINTRQLAKSQRTWFKRFRAAQWLDVSPDDTAGQIADQVMNRQGDR